MEKMPCFDPHEVFFLTNQWDIVENDDDDEAYNEKSGNPESRTWKLVLSKLRKGWPGVNEQKIYQTSLKQVNISFKFQQTNSKHMKSQILLIDIHANIHV